MDIEQIMEIIPQRYPMLLLDSVDELDVMKYAHGYKAVTYNEPFFQGHFPGKPVLPGIIIIEALSQLCNVMVLGAEEYRGQYIYYAKMAKVKFVDIVRPGCVMELKATKKAQSDNIVVCVTEALVEGQIVFSAEMHFMIVEE